MVCSLSRIFQHVELYIPFRLKGFCLCWTGGIFQSYGKPVPKNLKIRFIIKNRGSKFGYETAAEKRKYEKKDALVFSRSLQVAHHFAKNDYPVLFEAHNFAKNKSYDRFDDFIKTLQKNKQAKIISISQQIEALYLKTGLAKEKIATFPDGVDLSLFEKTNRNFLGSAFGSGIYARKNVLYTGSLAEEKGVGFIIGAAGKIKNYNFIIIGGKKSEIGQLTRRFHTVENLFFHPAIDYKLIPSALMDADYLVMPYLRSGKLIAYMSPLKMFDYLAAEKIILSSDLPVLKPVLQNNENIIFFEPESIDSFKTALTNAEILTSKRPDVEQKPSRNMRIYSWENRVSNILDWYYQDRLL